MHGGEGVDQDAPPDPVGDWGKPVLCDQGTGPGRQQGGEEEAEGREEEVEEREEEQEEQYAEFVGFRSLSVMLSFFFTLFFLILNGFVFCFTISFKFGVIQGVIQSLCIKVHTLFFVCHAQILILLQESRVRYVYIYCSYSMYRIVHFHRIY